MPSVSMNPDQAAVQLARHGYMWSTVLGLPLSLTYAFRATDASYGHAPPYGPGTGGTFTRFNSTQIAQTILALQAWADVANITFTRVGTGSSGSDAYSDNATILFGDYNYPYAGYDPSVFQNGVMHAYTFLPETPGDQSAAAADGDLWVNTYWTYERYPSLWNGGQDTLVHEIGHALGLEHPGDYDQSQSTVPTYATDAAYVEDDRQYSVMSYFDEGNTGANFHGSWPAAPQLDDIAAIQRLYGANMSTRTGNTVYGYNSTADRPWFSATDANSVLIFCVWDAGGTDTFDFSGCRSSQLIDLQATHFSNVQGMVGNVSIAEGVTIENAIGGSAGDTIIGNSANNVLTGGGGNDALSGGGGKDTAEFSGNRAGYTITHNTDGSVTVSGLDGTDTLNHVELAAFADQMVAVGTAAPCDFTGDGMSDLLWQCTTGQAGIWMLNGTSVVSGPLVGADPGPDWHVIGAGDVDGDGKADLFWQSTDGQAGVWLMNGSAITASALVGANPGPDWQLKGSGDFNSDGKADLLWQCVDGQVGTWLMNGSSMTGSALMGADPGPDWKVIAAGDFNGDGKTDILWQCVDGQAAIWLMNGTTLTSGAVVGPYPGPDWKIKAAGDFDGDGKADILWQSIGGQAGIWFMNGTTLVSGALIGPNPGTDWKVMGAEDVNGDGKSDILWQSVGGQAGAWLMSGSTILGSSLIGTNPGTDWHLIGATGG